VRHEGRTLWRIARRDACPPRRPPPSSGGSLCAFNHKTTDIQGPSGYSKGRRGIDVGSLGIDLRKWKGLDVITLRDVIFFSGGYLIAPVLLIAILIGSYRTHRLKLKAGKEPSLRNQVFVQRLGLAAAALIFLAFLIPWASAFLSTRFDWTTADAEQIEVATFASPSMESPPVSTFWITDRKQIERVIAALSEHERYQSLGHEHFTGLSYRISLQHRSDHRWSNYKILLFPNREPTGGGLEEHGVYGITIAYDKPDWELVTLRASKFGSLVEALAAKHSTHQ
jgi:hypothetical protein